MSDTNDMGELPVVEIDRDEAAFEAGGSGREAKREEKSINRLLRQRAVDRAENDALKRRLAELEAAQHKGRLSGYDADLDAAEREAEQALAEGDAARAVKLQRRMMQLEAAKKAAEYEAPQAAPQVEAPPDVQDWLEENGDWFNKPGPKREAALDAHHVALARGVGPGHPDYLKRINAAVAKVQGEDDADDEPAAPQRRVASGPAPVSNRTAPGRAGPTRIRLTPEEADFAKSLGLTEAVYAAQKMTDAAAGKLGPQRR